MIEILEKKVDELYRQAAKEHKESHDNNRAGSQSLAGRHQALYEVLALIRELKPEHYRVEQPGYTSRTNDPIGDASRARGIAAMEAST